jgi:hypothetical protein
MHNPYIQRVYQKLAHCRILLAQAQLSSDSITGKQQQEALLQGGAVHLAVAYRFYLRELAQGYSLPHPEGITDLGALLNHAQAAGQLWPEAEELTRLEAEGWLADLLRAEADVLLPSLEAAPKTVNIIAASTLIAEPLTPQLLSEWLTHFADLVERQRMSGEEY